MKKLVFLSFAALTFASCSNNNTNDDTAADRDSIVNTSPDTSATVFKITEEDALRLVSQVPEIDKELNRTFSDTAVKNVLLLMQGATSEDPRHYVQLMEMHPENAVALMHFSVDAASGEVKVMDPLSEEETWISLDKWRKMKI